jgi:hypothetical protein
LTFAPKFALAFSSTSSLCYFAEFVAFAVVEIYAENCTRTVIGVVAHRRFDASSHSSPLLQLTFAPKFALALSSTSSLCYFSEFVVLPVVEIRAEIAIAFSSTLSLYCIVSLLHLRICRLCSR